jgi:hypothetical protein
VHTAAIDLRNDSTVSVNSAFCFSNASIRSAALIDAVATDDDVGVDGAVVDALICKQTHEYIHRKIPTTISFHDRSLWLSDHGTYGTYG